MNFNHKAKLSPVVMLLLSSSLTTEAIRINNNNADSWDDIAIDNNQLAQTLIQKDRQVAAHLND